MGLRVYTVNSFNSAGECTEKLGGCLAPVPDPQTPVAMNFVYYDHTFHLVCANCLQSRLKSGEWEAVQE